MDGWIEGRIIEGWMNDVRMGMEGWMEERKEKRQMKKGR